MDKSKCCGAEISRSKYQPDGICTRCAKPCEVEKPAEPRSCGNCRHKGNQGILGSACTGCCAEIELEHWQPEPPRDIDPYERQWVDNHLEEEPPKEQEAKIDLAKLICIHIQEMGWHDIDDYDERIIRTIINDHKEPPSPDGEIDKQILEVIRIISLNAENSYLKEYKQQLDLLYAHKHSSDMRAVLERFKNMAYEIWKDSPENFGGLSKIINFIEKELSGK